MNYIIKNIDKKFWHKVKLMALRRNKSVKEIILKHLEREVEKEK